MKKPQVIYEVWTADSWEDSGDNFGNKPIHVCKSEREAIAYVTRPIGDWKFQFRRQDTGEVIAHGVIRDHKFELRWLWRLIDHGSGHGGWVWDAFENNIIDYYGDTLDLHVHD